MIDLILLDFIVSHKLLQVKQKSNSHSQTIPIISTHSDLYKFMHKWSWNSHSQGTNQSTLTLYIDMAKLCAYFIFFLLFSIILKPEIYTVEARLLLKKSRWQQNELRRLSSRGVKPLGSGPSPGSGHGFKNRKKTLMEVENSGPSPGAGNGFENSKKTFIVVNHSGPSPGEGHERVPVQSIDKNRS